MSEGKGNRIRRGINSTKDATNKDVITEIRPALISRKTRLQACNWHGKRLRAQGS
jgi:hypothetical protein